MNFVFDDVPKGKYQVGWVLTPGTGFMGTVGVNNKIAVYLDHTYKGGTYQTTEIIDASGGQYTYSADIAVSSTNGAFFTCVLTRIA